MQAHGWCQPMSHRPSRYTRKLVDSHATASRLNRRLSVNRQKKAIRSSARPTSSSNCRNGIPISGSATSKARADPIALKHLAKPVMASKPPAKTKNHVVLPAPPEGSRSFVICVIVFYSNCIEFIAQRTVRIENASRSLRHRITQAPLCSNLATHFQRPQVPVPSVPVELEPPYPAGGRVHEPGPAQMGVGSPSGLGLGIHTRLSCCAVQPQSTTGQPHVPLPSPIGDNPSCYRRLPRYKRGSRFELHPAFPR